jgi:hypothetical protein
MTDKKLAVVAPIRPEYDARLVEALESWIEDVKSGKIIGLAIIGKCGENDGTFQRQVRGDISLGLVLTAVEYIKADGMGIWHNHD